MTGEGDSALAVSSTFAIDREAFAALGEKLVRQQLQAFARSTRVEVDLENGARLLLRGTDLAHHTADPYLRDNVHMLPVEVNDDDYANFHAHLAEYDLCMEDSWTGYFVAQCLAERSTHEPLVFIHLDDHTDMMSTLLSLTSDGLKDPSIGERFDPVLPADWKSAIRSGAVGIGDFVTALYYLKQPVHVLHLNHVANSRYERHHIVPHTITHPLLPRVRFAAIDKRPRKSGGQLGTYIAGSSVKRLLNSLPKGRVIVHIDLDYFINDYNGNIDTAPARSVGELREHASILMMTFFDGIRSTGVSVDRWIIATSPGFCSARHWRWLLDELSTHIRAATQVFPD